eukprot:1844890-Rhodomonas_salina.3
MANPKPYQQHRQPTPNADLAHKEKRSELCLFPRFLTIAPHPCGGMLEQQPANVDRELPPTAIVIRMHHALVDVERCVGPRSKLGFMARDRFSDAHCQQMHRSKPMPRCTDQPWAII